LLTLYRRHKSYESYTARKENFRRSQELVSGFLTRRLYTPTQPQPTRREFLGLYVVDRPKSEPEKQQNKETKSLAESIRAKRQIEIQAGIYGFTHQAKRRTDFLAYFRSLTKREKASENNYENWMSAYNYLEMFTKGHLPDW